MRIGEVARKTGEPVRTLRYWADLGVMDAVRDPESGYRLFDPDAVRRVAFIRAAQRLGFTLDDVRDVLDVRRRHGRPCHEVRERLEAHLQDVRARIEELRLLEDDLANRLTWAEAHPHVPCENDCVYVRPDG